jgi:poly(3-hydroxybutyrate) depolymerase/thiol-disulfide isomerase/thioredoxin
MRTFLKRSMIVASIGLVTLFVAMLAYYFANRPSPDVREFVAIQVASTYATSELWEARRNAKSRDRKDKASIEYAAKIDELAARCLQLSEKYPDTTGQLAALFWAACHASKTDLGRTAYEMLSARVRTADLGQLGRAITYAQVESAKAIRGIAPHLLDRVKQSPNHPQAAHLLAKVCVMSKDDSEGQQPTVYYAEAADLIASGYASSPDITNFCVSLTSEWGSPLWAGSYERHLRTILEENNDRRVRCAALFALASVVQSSGGDRQVEAGELYEQFVNEFDGQYKYYNQRVERHYHGLAEIQLDEIRSRGFGKLAPEIVGVDINGRPMKLSDYRGNVVLLSFWATWCFPCMKFIPHERALAARLEGDPFAIVGVNGDTDEEAVRDAVATHKITWRSFRDRLPDGQAISDEWQVVGWPTLYLIDREGVIRKRWIDGPSPAELNREVDLLVLGSATAVEPGNTAKNDATAEDKNAIGSAAAEDRGDTRQIGFMHKVYQGPDGYAAKYVVFIPHSYDRERELPVILFLHGAGRSGTDGRRQIRDALAKAIRKQEQTFAFIAVFPQAQVGDWQADSPDGKRALAILNEVQKNYNADAKRVYLTGLSMGGEGTWSLAAAHPKRWAAIVPISGGGDTGTADKIKGIPCWCFHGDADRATPAILSREMVRAIKNAGGRPLYTEYSGVGHDENCWDRVYGDPNLYEWLLLQSRP